MRVSDDDITISFVDQSTIGVSWLGTDGLVSWIYVNGVLYQTTTIAGTNKSLADIDIDLSKPVRVEIHELAAGVLQQYPCETPAHDEPVVYWLPVTTALRYIIRGYKAGDPSVKRLKIVESLPGTVYYQEQIIQPMSSEGGAYWWMRVNSVSQYNIESSATYWPYHLKGIPPTPTGMTVTQTGPTMTFTLQV